MADREAQLKRADEDERRKGTRQGTLTLAKKMLMAGYDFRGGGEGRRNLPQLDGMLGCKGCP
jgi:hypothetical protein